MTPQAAAHPLASGSAVRQKNVISAFLCGGPGSEHRVVLTGSQMSKKNRDEMGATTGRLFGRLAAGDEAALNDLLKRFDDRLRRLAKKIFAAKRRLAGLYQTDDVRQGAVTRLIRAIRTRKPETPLHFRRLMAQCLRREIMDLSRKAFGEHGDGGRIFANRPGSEEKHDGLIEGRADSGAGPQTLAIEAEFHRKVGELPGPELEVFELIHYGGYTRQEVAELLGVSPKTVYRRWCDARVQVQQILKERNRRPRQSR
jgi:RNA polymerase sigma factor (sigma-70 family)